MIISSEQSALDATLLILSPGVANMDAHWTKVKMIQRTQAVEPMLCRSQCLGRGFIRGLSLQAGLDSRKIAGRKTNEEDEGHTFKYIHRQPSETDTTTQPKVKWESFLVFTAVRNSVLKIRLKMEADGSASMFNSCAVKM